MLDEEYNQHNYSILSYVKLTVSIKQSSITTIVHVGLFPLFQHNCKTEKVHIAIIKSFIIIIFIMHVIPGSGKHTLVVIISSKALASCLCPFQ